MVVRIVQPLRWLFLLLLEEEENPKQWEWIELPVQPIPLRQKNSIYSGSSYVAWNPCDMGYGSTLRNKENG